MTASYLRTKWRNPENIDRPPKVSFKHIHLIFIAYLTYNHTKTFEYPAAKYRGGVREIADEDEGKAPRAPYIFGKQRTDEGAKDFDEDD